MHFNELFHLILYRIPRSRYYCYTYFIGEKTEVKRGQEVKTGQSQLVMEMGFEARSVSCHGFIINQQHTWFSEMDPYMGKDCMR